MKNNILIWGMITFMIILGWALPYVATEFNFSTSDNDIDNFQNEILQEDVSATDIVFSISTIWFWSFNVPTLINLLMLLPLRILFWFIIYDKFRGVGS